MSGEPALPHDSDIAVHVGHAVSTSLAAHRREIAASLNVHQKSIQQCLGDLSAQQELFSGRLALQVTRLEGLLNVVIDSAPPVAFGIAECDLSEQTPPPAPRCFQTDVLHLSPVAYERTPGLKCVCEQTSPIEADEGPVQEPSDSDFYPGIEKPLGVRIDTQICQANHENGQDRRLPQEACMDDRKYSSEDSTPKVQESQVASSGATSDAQAWEFLSQKTEVAPDVAPEMAESKRDDSKHRSVSPKPRQSPRHSMHSIESKMSAKKQRQSIMGVLADQLKVSPKKRKSCRNSYWSSHIPRGGRNTIQEQANAIETALMEPAIGRTAFIGEDDGEDEFESEGIQFSQAPISWIVHSPPFEGVCAVMMIANAILIAWETEYEAQQSHVEESPRFFMFANLSLHAWYLFEVMIKLYVHRRWFFFGLERKWNILDFGLVLASLVDIMLEHLFSKFIKTDAAVGTGMIFRGFRLCRLVRNVRIVRYLNFAREFRKMVLSMINCMELLFWSTLMLFSFFFTFGICFTQAATTYRLFQGGSEDSDLVLYFGSLYLSWYTLYMSVCDGISWGVIADSLFEYNAGFGILFLAYIYLTIFGVLNVVTSVFVDSAMQTTQQHRDLLVEEKMQMRRIYKSHMKHIFETVDKDSSGEISIDEVRRLFKDPALSQYVEALEVNPSDAMMLFKLLDKDSSGCIDIDEFCDGCLRLQGDAKSFDVYCLMYQSDLAGKRAKAFMEAMGGALMGINEQFERIQQALSHIHRCRDPSFVEIADVSEKSSCKANGHDDAKVTII